MFKHILLPVDLTDRHALALETAVNLARSCQGTLSLLHVIELIPGLPREEDRAFYERLERTARQHLARWTERIRRLNAEARGEVQLGNRVTTIVGYAVDHQTDLIVLTAPRFDPENLGSGWGSLSYKISILAPCPVLLVKEKAEG
jgi:nucleotide-binding universal stress UspA family protein